MPGRIWVEGTNTASRSPKPIPIIRPRQTLTPPALSALHHHQRTRRKLMSCIRIACHLFFKFGFSTKVTNKKSEKIRERDEREALRKKQKLDNCIINIDDDYIDFGGLGGGGDTV